MTDDAKLIERLRAWHTSGETITGDVALYLEAADRLETLLGENARLVGIIDFMTAANAMQAEGSAAVTAIAPRLKAQGMREAAEMHNDNDFETWVEWREAILARAQELDPPVKP
jgi:hypothetical protein